MIEIKTRLKTITKETGKPVDILASKLFGSGLLLRGHSWEHLVHEDSIDPNNTQIFLSVSETSTLDIEGLPEMFIQFLDSIVCSESHRWMTTHWEN